MNLIDRYLPRADFENYRDFKENFRLNVPEDFDYPRDIVDVYAKECPEKLALLYCTDHEEDTRKFTFGEVSLLSKKAAAYLAAKGIKKGDRVLTLLRRRWEYWITAVALHRLGAVPVPASIQLTEHDLAYRVDAASVKMIIAINDPFVLKQTDFLMKECPSLLGIALTNDAFGDYWDYSEFLNCEPYEGCSGLRNEDEFIVYFTSGTSGYPKMAIHNRTYALGHIITARYMQHVFDDGLHLTQADSGWAKFGWGNIYGQWLCGSAVLGYDPIRFDGKNLLKVMEQHKPTSLCIPPTMYRFLLHSGLEQHHVASIRWFATAGEALSGEVNSAFHEITGHYIHEGYGQSETTPITCSFEWMGIRPSAMGRPSPLYEVFLMHPDGSKCHQGETGEVVIRPAKNQVGLLTSYFADGKTIDPFAEDGLYHTGDTAYEDESGYYWYVGRNDDIIKSSGYRIGPFEIESILNTHEAVKESAIVGRPHPMRGQIVCAIITLRDGFEPSEELTKELQDYVKTHTAPYKYPRVIKYVSELPKTTSGKIIRSELRGLAAE